ncbi:MAG: ArsR/SmtB family transcription factor [Burkholderiaceae bacterium]
MTPRRARTLSPAPADAAGLFAALGDQTRLALLARLSPEEAVSIAHLADQAPVTRQAITRHLQVLADAGLVAGERRGREHLWRLQPQRLADAQAALASIAAQWGDALERLRAYVDDGRSPEDA